MHTIFYTFLFLYIFFTRFSFFYNAFYTVVKEVPIVEKCVETWEFGWKYILN